MRYVLLCLLACLTLPAISLAADAPKPAPVLTDAEKAQVEKQIKALDANDFSVRDGAEKSLIAMGAKILPSVKAALENTKEPEVRSRLGHIAQAFAPGPSKLEIEAALATTVTFEFADTSLADALKTLQGMSKGVLVLEADPSLANASISLKVTAMKVSLALEWIGKVAGAKVEVNGNHVSLKP